MTNDQIALRLIRVASLFDKSSNDCTPGVTNWTDIQLIECIFSLLGMIEELENEIDAIKSNM